MNSGKLGWLSAENNREQGGIQAHTFTAELNRKLTSSGNNRHVSAHKHSHRRRKGGARGA